MWFLQARCSSSVQHLVPQNKTIRNKLFLGFGGKGGALSLAWRDSSGGGLYELLYRMVNPYVIFITNKNPESFENTNFDEKL